jgi:hypothetical protein
MRVQTRALLLSTLVLTLTGALDACAAGRYRPLETPATNQRYAVRIDSHQWNNVTVYAMKSGIRWNIGTVPAGQSRTFVVTQQMIDVDGRLRLAVRPDGKPNAYEMEPIDVHPGEFVSWAIEDALERSSVAVFQVRR